jgi:hypothetical protein
MVVAGSFSRATGLAPVGKQTNVRPLQHKVTAMPTEKRKREEDARQVPNPPQRRGRNFGWFAATPAATELQQRLQKFHDARPELRAGAPLRWAAGNADLLVAAGNAGGTVSPVLAAAGAESMLERAIAVEPVLAVTVSPSSQAAAPADTSATFSPPGSPVTAASDAGQTSTVPPSPSAPPPALPTTKVLDLVVPGDSTAVSPLSHAARCP